MAIHDPSRYPRLIRLLWLGVAICLLVVAGLLSWGVTQENSLARRQQESSLLKVAAINAALLERNLADHDRFLLSLRNLVRDDMPSASIDQLLRQELATQQELLDLLILNRHGRIVHWTQDYAPPDVSKRPYYTLLRDDPTDRAVLSPPLPSMVHKEQFFIALSRPVFTIAGQFDGVVVAIVSLSKLAQVFATDDGDTSTAIAVADMAGRTLFRLPRVPGDSGTVMEGIAELPPDFRKGNIVQRSPFNDKDWLVGVQRLGRYPLWMAAANEVTAYDRRQQINIIIAFGLFFLFAVPLLLLARQLLLQFDKQRTAEDSLRAQTEALSRSNAELEQFAYAASHDLRQPLRMVNSYVQLLERRLAETLDEDTRKMMHFVTEGATRMDQMLVSLLEYSRVGRKGEPMAPLSSRAAVDEALHFLAPAIREAGAQINVSGDWPTILASRDEFTRLLQNLISNAVKYRAPERVPEVEITAIRDIGSWRFCISDNGIGIDPEQFDRLFRVFQRLHTRDKYEGSGIGLAVSRKIVERHGGRIWVESGGAGQGCRFCFTLPAHRLDQEAGQ